MVRAYSSLQKFGQCFSEVNVYNLVGYTNDKKHYWYQLLPLQTFLINYLHAAYNRVQVCIPKK